MAKRFLPQLVLILFMSGFAHAQGMQQNVPCDTYKLVGSVIIPVRDHPENFEVLLLSKQGEQVLAYSNVNLAGRYQFTGIHTGEMDFVIRLEGFKELRETVRITPTLQSIQNGASLHPSMDCFHEENFFLTPVDTTVVLDERLKGYSKEAIDEYVLAVAADSDKHFEDVVKHLEKVVKLAPDWFDAHCELGAAYEEVHRTSDAEMEYRAALNLKPDGMRPTMNLGRLLVAEAEDKIQVAAPPDVVQPILNQAHEVLTSAVERDPMSPMASYMLGTVNFRLANFKDAEVELKRALELDATLFPARITLINVYIEQKQWENALDNVDSFLLENPASPLWQQVASTRASVVRRLQKPQ